MHKEGNWILKESNIAITYDRGILKAHQVGTMCVFQPWVEFTVISTNSLPSLAPQMPQCHGKDSVKKRSLPWHNSLNIYSNSDTINSYAQKCANISTDLNISRLFGNIILTYLLELRRDMYLLSTLLQKHHPNFTRKEIFWKKTKTFIMVW